MNIRNSIFAGRKGTMSVGGRPQVRWEQGVELAKSVKDTRSTH